MSSVMITLANAISIAFEIVVLLIIVRAVMSFFPRIDRSHPMVRFLDQIVEPILKPFQRLLPSMGGLDFSPILAILTIQLVGRLLAGFLVSLGRGF